MKLSQEVNSKLKQDGYWLNLNFNINIKVLVFLFVFPIYLFRPAWSSAHSTPQKVFILKLARIFRYNSLETPRNSVEPTYFYLFLPTYRLS